MSIGICYFFICSYSVLKLIDVLKPHILQFCSMGKDDRYCHFPSSRSERLPWSIPAEACSSYLWRKHTDSGRKKRKTQREKEKQQKIFSRKKYSFGKLNHAETINFTTDSTIAMGNLKPYFPFLKDLPFNLIRAGAERSDVPRSFWKMTGKTPCNQEVFRISIDFQFSWFICSLSEHLMLVCSELYVEFALIRCLCSRH